MASKVAMVSMVLKVIVVPKLLMVSRVAWCLNAMLPKMPIVSMVSLLPVVLKVPMVYLVPAAYDRRLGKKTESPTGNPSPAPTHSHRTHDTTDQWRDPRLWLG